MSKSYLSHVPKPLLDDLVNGRWLPVVGAGLSRNAVVPAGRTMPLWPELGKSLADDMNGYEYVSPIDAISAYAYLFGRPKLIERLHDLLLIGDAQPSSVHQAFCEIQFDIVCTTNFDFLLEKQYERTPRLCVPLIDQDQLSIAQHESSVALLKLHGDLNHPARLVATEDDYDLFLERYPVIATYLAYLMATRTPVLIGYSLEDPDFRQLWQVIGERLGKARRHAYALTVNAGPSVVARFERRGVKVVNLPRSSGGIGHVLAKTFKELSDYWRRNVLDRSQVVEEEQLRELALPADSSTRLCFFALPLSAHPFYREAVFPLVRDMGLVPVTADSIISPGDNAVAKIDALISRAFLVVVDASSEFTLAEARMALIRKDPDKTFIIVGEDTPSPAGLPRGTMLVRRPDLASPRAEQFFSKLAAELRHASLEFAPDYADETRRLLDAREYRAAVISAIARLEVELKSRLDIPVFSRRPGPSIRELVQNAAESGFLGRYNEKDVVSWLRIRNEAVHQRTRVAPKSARQIVDAVEEIVRRLDN